MILPWVFTETSGCSRNWLGSLARTQATLLQVWTDNGPRDGAGNRRLRQKFCLGFSSPAGAIKDGVFFDVEANFRLRWLRRRLQQGAELLEDFPQRHVMNQQRFVYLGQASENGGVRGDILAHF